MEDDWRACNSEPLLGDYKSSVNPTASCPLNNQYVYGYAILFDWNENLQRPFKMYSRQTFPNQDISDRCYTKHLSDDLRVRKLRPMKMLPGARMSLFAKVEASMYYF